MEQLQERRTRLVAGRDQVSDAGQRAKIEERLQQVDREIGEIGVQQIKSGLVQIGPNGSREDFARIGQQVDSAIRANNARIADIEREQAGQGGYQSLDGKSDRQRAELDHLKKVNSQLSNALIGAQVNIPADPRAPSPPGREGRHAQVPLAGADTPLPKSTTEERAAIKNHVEQKSGSTPYLSWTASERAAVQGYGGRAVAVADIPKGRFADMVKNREVLLPSTVRGAVAERYHKDQELLVARVDRNSWAVNDMQETVTLQDDSHFSDVKSYQGSDGQEYVRIYRSLHPRDLAGVPDLVTPRTSVSSDDPPVR